MPLSNSALTFKGANAAGYIRSRLTHASTQRGIPGGADASALNQLPPTANMHASPAMLAILVELEVGSTVPLMYRFEWCLQNGRYVMTVKSCLQCTSTMFQHARSMRKMTGTKPQDSTHMKPINARNVQGGTSSPVKDCGQMHPCTVSSA